MRKIPASHERGRSRAMRAVRVHRFGGLEAIVYEEVSRPVPAEGQVLVRVKAAGVGPWDAWVWSGKSALPQPLPLILGSDLSGIVEEVGTGVSGFQPGAEIFGVTNSRFIGAYAELTRSAARSSTDLSKFSSPGASSCRRSACPIRPRPRDTASTACFFS
jgi:NADPH:quinone reductase-like Zn-dependent oxidoreductase